jgi:hypothetical protein
MSVTGGRVKTVHWLSFISRKGAQMFEATPETVGEQQRKRE